VSIDLQEPQGGLDAAQGALEEFQATQNEFSEFFGDVFDQLQALSLDLFARHKCRELGAEQKSAADEAMARFREELGRSVESLQALHGQFHTDQFQTRQTWTEIRGDYKRFLDDYEQLRDVRQGFQQLAGEFSGIKQEMRQVRSLLEALACQTRGDPAAT
jgi:soluble cytochrome b562